MESAFDAFLDTPITAQTLEAEGTFNSGTLANMRAQGRGPKFFRPPGSRKIFYTRRAIYDWIKAQPIDPSKADKSHSDIRV